MKSRPPRERRRRAPRRRPTIRDMSLSTSDLAHLVTALVLLLAAAHGCGFLFRQLRQPPVLGEVLGGLLLGPTSSGSGCCRSSILRPSWGRHEARRPSLWFSRSGSRSPRSPLSPAYSTT